MALAESIDTAHDQPTSEPIPSERTITREEETILWQTLQQIPNAYREPLILFYREGESVERVAAVLDISEDAAKQRLSRGRKLLHEKVVALVEGGLRQSIPGKTFTLAVMAALPGVTISTKAATLGAAAAKAGTAAKVAGVWAGLLAISPVALVGGWIGRLMGRDSIQGPEPREWVTWVWRMVVGVLVFLVPLFLLLMASDHRVTRLLFQWFHSREEILTTITVWLSAVYLVVAGTLGTWMWRRGRRLRRGQVSQSGPTAARRRPLVGWVLAAMLGASVLLGALFSDSNWGVQKLSTEQVHGIIAREKHAQYALLQWRNGSQRLWITVPNAGKKAKFEGPVDQSTVALLAGNGIAYTTYVEGQDFGVFGWPGNLLPFLCLFILAAGFVILLVHPKFATRKILMKAITAGIIGAAIALAAVGTAVSLRHHRDHEAPTGGDPFEMQQLSNEENAHYAAMTPQEAARAFFEACGRGDWTEVDKFCAGIMPLEDRFKEWMTGVTVVSIGQPFTRSGFAATFVPYEIRFKNGESKKFNLAIRRDNPQGRWMFDGGL